MERNAVFFFILLGGAVVAGVFGSARPETVQRASIGDTLATREEVFASPVPVDWSGRVFGAMESGGAYALHGADGAPESFYAGFGQSPEQPLEGHVRIRGLLVGTTCAYRNTVFNGQCVPEVLILQILP